MRPTNETLDVAVAAIRRTAVTQTHAVRREMMRMADLWGKGVQLSTKDDDRYGGILAVDIPIFLDGELSAHAQIVFTLGKDGKARVETGVREWDPEMREFIEPDVSISDDSFMPNR